MSSDTKQRTRESALYNIFTRYFPEHRSQNGVLAVPRLAKDMGYSHEAIYKALRRAEIKVPVAHTILQFSQDEYPEQPLFWQDLEPFVLPDFEELSDPAILAILNDRVG